MGFCCWKFVTFFLNFHLVAEKMRNSCNHFQYSFVYFTCGYLIQVVLFLGLTEGTCWKCLDFLYKVVHCPVAFVGFNSLTILYQLFSLSVQASCLLYKFYF